MILVEKPEEFGSKTNGQAKNLGFMFQEKSMFIICTRSQIFPENIQIFLQN